jgi:hypothetical protein
MRDSVRGEVTPTLAACARDLPALGEVKYESISARTRVGWVAGSSPAKGGAPIG